MSVYIITIVLATVFSIVAEVLKDSNGRCHSVSVLSLLMTMIILAIPLCTRTVGVDYDNYRTTYDIINTYSFDDYWKHIWSGRPEPLYALLCMVAKAVFNSFLGVNVLCGAITILFFFLMVNQWKDEVELSATVMFFCIQYYLFCYGLNRMMIAVAIIGWTYRLFLERKHVMTSVGIVIAGLFHYSAFFMFVIYMSMIWMNRKIVVVSNTGVLKSTIVIAIAVSLLYRITSVLFGGFSWFIRYLGYFNTGFTPKALNNNIPCYLVLLLYAAYAARETDDYQLFGLHSFISIFLSLSIVSIILPVHRIIYLLYPSIALTNGALVKQFYARRSAVNSNSSEIIIYYILLLAIGALWIHRTLTQGELWAPYLVPYKGTLFCS